MNKTADFDYNTDQQRIRMVLKAIGTATKTRYYFGSSCEREVVAGVTTQYIWIGGDAYTAVAVAKKVGAGSWVVYNIFRDHLGTITHLKTGSTITEYSFDAWGRRRDKDDWTYTLTSEPVLFADRGFTGHEYLADFKLYNMNGRLYDPVVGRFLSADPIIQDPGFTQSYNRYSYCLNNPLKFTDPSGNTWWSKLWNWMNEHPTQVGFNVNGAGNVNANASVNGHEVFNTANIDRSGPSVKATYDELAQVRKDYGPAWKAASGGFDNTVGYLGTFATTIDYAYTANITLNEIGVSTLKLGTKGKILLGSAGYIAAGASTIIDYRDPKISASRFSYRFVGNAAALGVGYFSGIAVAGALTGGTFWAGEQTYDALIFCRNQYLQFSNDLNNAIQNGWRPGY